MLTGKEGGEPGDCSSLFFLRNLQTGDGRVGKAQTLVGTVCDAELR